MTYRLVLIALLLSMPLATRAQTTMLYGVGTESCGAWLKYRQAKSWEIQVRESWVNGFLSAYNALGPNRNGDIGQGIDHTRRMAWIDSYCQSHPSADIASATTALIADLRHR